MYIAAGRNSKKLDDYTTYLDLTFEEFFQIVTNYIEKSINIPEYVTILNNLVDIQDKEKVITYLNSVSLNYKNLRDNLMAYFLRYRPDIYYVKTNLKKRLSDNLTLYESHLAKLDKPINCEKLSINDYASNTILEYINSEYSIPRFCFNKNISTTNFKKYIVLVKNNNPSLYEEFVNISEIKNDIQSKNISENVLKLLNIIKENPNISIIDILLMTNYDIFELINEADKLLSIDDIKLFRKTIKPIRYIDRFNQSQVNGLLNSNFVFNINNELVNISEDDKQYVISFLQENNIPISNETFKEGCIKNYLNELSKECYEK